MFKRVKEVVLGDGKRYETLWGHSIIQSNARWFKAI